MIVTSFKDHSLVLDILYCPNCRIALYCSHVKLLKIPGNAELGL